MAIGIPKKEYKPCAFPPEPMYVYGMRLRGFSPGCQPMDGLGSVMKGNEKYHNILIYNRELTDKEIMDYELDRIPEEGDVNANNT